jgi:hypothetical protein
LISHLDVPLPVACGATVDILHTGPGADSFPVGAVVTVTEDAAPTGGAPTTLAPVTLTAGDQTVTVTNAGTPVAAGRLSIHKTCATGVTGTAVFDAKVTPFGQATVDVPDLSVECGSTLAVVIPTAADLVGATVIITETAAATGGVKATVSPVTLTAAAQTITVNNAKVSVTPTPTPTPRPTPTPTPRPTPRPTPTPAPAHLPQTGRGSESGGVLIGLLALSFLLVGTGVGIGLIRRTR